MRRALFLLLPLLSFAAENPQWPRHVIAEGFNSQSAVAADFTGDGLTDVIVDANGDLADVSALTPETVECFDRRGAAVDAPGLTLQ